MTIQLSRAQFAIILGLILVVFSSGVAAGAAGSPMIIGSEANNAGAANTQLLTDSAVVAFKLLQNGPGTALMGYTTEATGTTRGVYGRVDLPNGDGLQGRNAGPAGTGAAIRGYGGENAGAVLTSDYDYPLVLTGAVNVPPMSVNSSVKVANLNADKLDGKDSTAFVTNQTVTGHYGCDGIAMIPTITAGYGWSQGRYATATSNISFACPLTLPDGAVIKSLRGFVRDTSSTEEAGPCYIHRFGLLNGSTQAYGSTGATGIAFTGGSTSLDDFLLNLTIANTSNAYALYCLIDGTGSDVNIAGVQVTYEVTGLPVP